MNNTTSVKVGDAIETANTVGTAVQVDTFITKAGESTLRVKVEREDGSTKWVTIK